MGAAKGIFVAWYDTDPAFQPELDQWHSKEHMPERVALPGFRTGQRYRDVDDPWRYCVLYRADDIQTFASQPYLRVLNHPTDWTSKMMAGLRNLNRSLCSIVRDAGGGFGRILHTIQFAPSPTDKSVFVGWLDHTVVPAIMAEPWSVRLTLAVADKAISQTKTIENTLRAQPDAVSDWILLVECHVPPAQTSAWQLLAESMEEHGGRHPVRRTFQLAHLLVASEA